MEAVKSVNSTNKGANNELSWMWQTSKKQPSKLFTAAVSKPINTVNTAKRNISRTPSPTTNTVGGAKNKKSRKSRRNLRKNKSRKSRKNISRKN
jgi:hypothetical protein